QGHAFLAVAGDPDHIVTELLRLGHDDILPGSPVGKPDRCHLSVHQPPNSDTQRTQGLHRELDQHRAEQRRRTLSPDEHAIGFRTPTPDNAIEHTVDINVRNPRTGPDYDLGY
ncbi:hypothetical protein, partial [Nocardia cyriacigeorgica]|uniref:hypothetical protein n=1 Tax=Nocardia cyriacigeorgica TaxID=135487 RepID=UPI002454113D